MKIKYVLAAALVAMFAIPGTASQLTARAALSSPLIAPAMVETAGLFNDPNVAPTLSIELPTKFVAVDVADPQPLGSFSG